jgi:hypothetical protein
MCALRVACSEDKAGASERTKDHKLKPLWGLGVKLNPSPSVERVGVRGHMAIGVGTPQHHCLCRSYYLFIYLQTLHIEIGKHHDSSVDYANI